VKRKFASAIVWLLLITLAGIPCAASAVTDLDIRRNQMSSNITYPAGIEFVKVHTAKANGHHFLLGASIIKYGDVWVCAYGQSLQKENDANSRFACKYSYDNCKTWSEEVEIAGVEGNSSRSHGVLFELEGKLWAYCPRASFNGGSTYPGLVMEAYTLKEDMTWQFEGVVLNASFWPLCEPMVLSNGDLLIAGLDCTLKDAAPAVAVSKGGDPTKWEMVQIPNSTGISLWGETTVIDYKDRLVAVIRTNSGTAAVSESLDFGRSWSSLVLSNFEIANSKVYGGALSTGSKYLIYNHGSRATMMISVGNSNGSYGFVTPYLIRNGYVTEPAFLNNRQWAYPYAVEEDGKLYVVYAENKENCELAIIPVSSLTPREESDEELPRHETAVAGQAIELPPHRLLCELVDGKEDWWSGDGASGRENIRYEEIDGVPAVVRYQAATTASKKNQVLRKHFNVDLSGVDLDRTAFVITFYSEKALPAIPSNIHRIFWGNSMSKSGENRPFSSDYSIVSRLDYRATSENLWGEVKAGWNTWLVSFRELGYAFHLADLNSFFVIFEDNTQVNYGSRLFAVSSVQVIEFTKEEQAPTPPITDEPATNEPSASTPTTEPPTTEQAPPAEDAPTGDANRADSGKEGSSLSTGAVVSIAAGVGGLSGAAGGGLTYLLIQSNARKKKEQTEE